VANEFEELTFELSEFLKDEETPKMSFKLGEDRIGTLPPPPSKPKSVMDGFEKTTTVKTCYLCTFNQSGYRSLLSKMHVCLSCIYEHLSD